MPDSRELRDSSVAVLESTQAVVEACQLRLSDLRANVGNYVNAGILRTMFGPRALTDGLRINWRQRETKLSDLLRSVQILPDPDEAIIRVYEGSTSQPIFPDLTNLGYFWDHAARRQRRLQRGTQVSSEAASPDLALQTWFESRTLRHALYAGVYFAQGDFAPSNPLDELPQPADPFGFIADRTQSYDPERVWSLLNPLVRPGTGRLFLVPAQSQSNS